MKRPSIVAAGEILWDLLPAGKQMGGAPANFAYHAGALGADAAVISRVGNDPLGREILSRLQTLRLPTTFISVDEAAPTGTVSVELQPDGQPRFTIHENVAWDRLTADAAALERAANADAICFGSLGQRCSPARETIQRIVAATPANCLRVFDINIRQHFYSREVIETSLQKANIFKLNDQELPIVAALFDLGGGVREQLAALAQRFSLRTIALTRGAGGSLLFADGVWSEHPGVRTIVVDAVGAGDAFTAAMTLGLLKRWPLDTINQRANEVASFVCSRPGATPVLAPQLAEMFSA